MGTAMIRRATAEDLVALQEIEDAADGLFASVFSIADWQPAPSGVERSRHPGFILVASTEPDSRPVGFAHVIEIPGGNHLEQLSVVPSQTGHGYGRALVEAVKTESTQLGRTRVTLRTYVDVAWNAPFYATCGFAESVPDNDFLRNLLSVERQSGLGYARRVQMTCDLSSVRSGMPATMRNSSRGGYAEDHDRGRMGG
ncbi:GNAT family N-acetyltransferase [Cryobacterium zhongshanensis]|uniref:GNAT family N-acetyltransferase n=1 Tax=Cryobacterium zhongshanensis TaxID=2928153 RepID=A0AA41QS75_9MICO|nr:GNAT family N-acetyltransferase [Cryobacterium zhongshanensis]MCI4656702.1 GNAT family N-acetyltransferase [Cryobacterium zhongshanensis]